MELAGAGASLAGLIGLNLTGPARSVITGCQRRLTVDDRAAEVQVGIPDIDARVVHRNRTQQSYHGSTHRLSSLRARIEPGQSARRQVILHELAGNLNWLGELKQAHNYQGLRSLSRWKDAPSPVSLRQLGKSRARQ